MAHTKEKDQIVLSYHDSLLRSSDVDLLKGTHWLNDVLIGFYYEYLTQQCQEDNNARLLFVSPSLTQLLKMEDPKNYGEFLDSLDAKNYHFVFFPLNDCDNLKSPGGTHWSLLVYSRTEQMCYHYDSSYERLNVTIAHDFMVNLIKYFSHPRHAGYTEMKTPFQTNDYDCGLYVLCLTDVISRYIFKTARIQACDFKEVQAMVRGKRTELLNLIETLKDVSHW